MRWRIPAVACSGVALVCLANVAHPEGQGRLSDATILGIIDFAHNAEIETGRLAHQRATAQDVKDLGLNLAIAHSQGREEARAIGLQLKIQTVASGSGPLANTHKLRVEKLHSVEGRAFDKAFVDQEISFHQALLELVRTSLIPSAGAELKTYLNKLTPALQAHLDETKLLQTRIVADQ
jgi:putative membrane protein